METVLILDFGSQFTQLIARKIRELGVYCEICPPAAAAAKLQQLKPIGIILSGGPQSALDDNAPQIPTEVLNYNTPVLGICYGMQMMMRQLGGKIVAGKQREYGAAKVRRAAPAGGAAVGGGDDIGDLRGDDSDDGVIDGGNGIDNDKGKVDGGGDDIGDLRDYDVGGEGGESDAGNARGEDGDVNGDNGRGKVDGGDGDAGNARGDDVGGGDGDAGNARRVDVNDDFSDGGCPLWAGVMDAGDDDAAADAAMTVWMSHGDRVETPAPGFAPAALSSDGVLAAVSNPARQLFGLQFHPEVAHTERGRELLKNFTRRICGARGQWTMPNFVDTSVAAIRAQVGDDEVLLALSGGVDSAVTAALTHRAVGAQLTCVLVDTGLLREGEAARIVAMFERQFGMRLRVANAGARFFAALAGVTDPEEKRRRIGHLFIEVFEEQAAALAGAGRRIKWLAQGTIYPDVVESAGGAGKDNIKSHHNVGGLPARLNFRLLEPLRELFKDEVRELGAILGLSRELLWQHPFPGPGLAVRVLGEVTAARAQIARRADAIFVGELRAAGVYGEVAQALAVLLPVQTVGVMGDSRTYENAVALRAVTTDDFMTANWARLPADLLARVSGRIINEVAGVNRVVYDISSKPPATVEWE